MLVFHDLLGINDAFKPKFVKRYAELRQTMVDAVTAYAEEVRTRVFPGPEHAYGVAPEEMERLKEMLAAKRAHAKRTVHNYTGAPMAGLSRLFAPREREFFDLFEEAGRNIVQAGELLERTLDRWPDHGELAREIVICEQEGDRITHDIIQRLNRRSSRRSSARTSSTSPRRSTTSSTTSRRSPTTSSSTGSRRRWTRRRSCRGSSTRRAAR